MDEKTTHKLYRLLPFMFLMQLLGFIIVISGFVYYGIFSGAFDLTGHEVLGLKEALVTVPLVFVLTAITYMIYPYPKNLAPWLLILTTVFNAVLGIQIIVLMFTLFIAFIDIFR